MLTFLDGHAKGIRIRANRAPGYVRLQQTVDGSWTALADLDAQPHEGVLFAYKKISNDGYEPSGEWVEDEDGMRQQVMMPRACYRLCDAQPSQQIMRSRQGWRSWAEEQVRPY